ncbi:MAG TPA: alpha/beta hydrolase [Gaiellaceae bacterium]
MAFLTSSDGVRLAYVLEGDGPALVLHTGAGCDADLWRAAGYVEPLAASYTCILFDHRGHGASDCPRGPAAYHVDRLTADVVELLDHLDLESVAFWGYSAGISPGIKLCEEQPRRVWALLGSGGIAPADSPEELADWLAVTVPEFRERGWETLLERFGKQEPDPIPDWMKERIRATDVGQYIDQLLALPDWDWDEWEALGKLSTPTLFLTGELEDPDDLVEQAVERMSNGARVRIAGQGHINAFLRSDDVLPHVTAFLAANAPA